MRFALALLSLLFALPAAAQDGTAVRWGDMGWSTTGRKSDATRAATTYYVATTGSDSNACTSEAAPCLTLQGAINRVPKNIYHAVTVQLGSGNFTGAYITNFTIHPSSARPVGLIIRGTLISATLATGSATGTATGVTSASGSTFATLTDTNANFTANDLRGKLIEITGGTGSSATAFYVISSNTQTVITLAGGWGTAPVAGSTYAIRDWGTVINAAPTAAQGPDGTSIGTARLLNFVGNSGGSAGITASDPIHIQKLKMSSSGGALSVFDSAAPIVLRWVYTGTTGTGTSLMTWNRGGIYYRNSYSFCSSTCQHMAPAPDSRNPDGSRVTSSMFHAGAYGFVETAGYIVISSSYLYAQTASGIENNVGALLASQIINSRIDCNSTGATGIKSSAGSATGGNVPFSLGVSSTDISNCATAISLRNPLAAGTISAVTGSSNTVGMSLTTGSKLKVDATTTLTGTTEVSIDGTTTTLATMRAASPKVVNNTNYFTAIYE